jgi:hypothetical protein
MQSVNVNFLNKFNLINLDDSLITIQTVYLGFTTLSTVGLGDFYPTDNTERIIAVFIMLGALIVFSMAV